MAYRYAFFVETITHALEMYARSISDSDGFMIELVRRCQKLWEHLRIQGIEFMNMTYEEFCDQCEKKKNIVFMSDEEFDEYKKAIRIYGSIASVIVSGDIDKFSVL